MVYFDKTIFEFDPSARAFLLPGGIILAAKHLPWCAVRKTVDMGTNALVYERDKQECRRDPRGERRSIKAIAKHDDAEVISCDPEKRG